MIKFLKRYTLKIEDMQTVEIPFGAEPQGMTENDGEAHLWYLVDTGADNIRHVFAMYAEGQSVDYRCNRTNCVGSFWAKGRRVFIYDIT